MDQFSFRFDAYGGLGEVRGVLQFDGELLRLHYQVADAMLGAIRSKPREVVFAPESVLEVSFSAGWFWLMPRVELQLSEVGKIADIPLETAGLLRLHLPFGQRKAARRLAASLALACSDRRLRRFDAELARMGGGGREATPQSGAAARPPRAAESE